MPLLALGQEALGYDFKITRRFADSRVTILDHMNLHFTKYYRRYKTANKTASFMISFSHYSALMVHQHSGIFHYIRYYVTGY